MTKEAFIVDQEKMSAAIKGFRRLLVGVWRDTSTATLLLVLFTSAIAFSVTDADSPRFMDPLRALIPGIPATLNHSIMHMLIEGALATLVAVSIPSIAVVSAVVRLVLLALAAICRTKRARMALDRLPGVVLWAKVLGGSLLTLFLGSLLVGSIVFRPSGMSVGTVCGFVCLAVILFMAVRFVIDSLRAAREFSCPAEAREVANV